jgi:hypothetical protein
VQTTTPPFDERLWPSPAVWLAVPAAAAMLGIVLWPLGTGPGVAGAVTGLVAAGAAAVASATRVRVADGELHAGAAHVPLGLLRDPVALDADATRAALGPELDARAYVCLRGWVRTAVRVRLDDPADPTPYWVVSTRRPDDLVRALQPADDDAGRTTGVRPAS